MNFSKEEMADAFEAYVNPHDEEFDPEFVKTIMRIRPDWLEEGDVERLVNAGLITVDEFQSSLEQFRSEN